MRVLLSAAAAIGLLLAAPAQAATTLEASLSNSTVQRNASIGYFYRSDIWRLNPDGTFSGNFVNERYARGRRYEVRGDVSGRWRVDGDDTLCLEGHGLEAAGEQCYVVTGGGGDLYSATNTIDGLGWQMFIYTR